MVKLGDWIEPHPHGIHVKPADAWIDPSEPYAAGAGHPWPCDHARGGHGRVWARPRTLAIMAARYGPQKWRTRRLWRDDQLGEVEIGFVPAGHVLGSRADRARLSRRADRGVG